jgi:hypothetical protein
VKVGVEGEVEEERAVFPSVEADGQPLLTVCPGTTMPMSAGSVE